MDKQMVMVRTGIGAAVMVLMEGRGSGGGVVWCVSEVTSLTTGQAAAWPGKELEWEGGPPPTQGQLVEWAGGKLSFLGQAAW
jgi:hypothetical protein